MWAILLQKVKMGVGTEEKVKMGTKEKVKMGFDTEKKVDLKVDSEKSKEADIKTIDIDNIGESRGLTDNLASEEVGEEKTGLLKKLKIWVDKDKDKDNQVKNKRKQIGRLQKSKPQRLQVFGGPTLLRPRHRTAKRAKVLLDFGQRKGWVKKVKKFRRQRQGGEQREKLKQAVAKAKVVAWLQGIEIEDWKSQMLHVLDRAV